MVTRWGGLVWFGIWAPELVHTSLEVVRSVMGDERRKRGREKDSKNSQPSVITVLRHTMHPICQGMPYRLRILSSRMCCVVRVPSPASVASTLSFFLALSSFPLFLSDFARGVGWLRREERNAIPRKSISRRRGKQASKKVGRRLCSVAGWLCWPAQLASLAHKSKRNGEDPTRTTKEWRYAGGGKQVRGTRG